MSTLSSGHENMLMGRRQDLIFIFKYWQWLLCGECLNGLGGKGVQHGEWSLRSPRFKKLVLWTKVLAEKVRIYLREKKRVNRTPCRMGRNELFHSWSGTGLCLSLGRPGCLVLTLGQYQSNWPNNWRMIYDVLFIVWNSLGAPRAKFLLMVVTWKIVWIT